MSVVAGKLERSATTGVYIDQKVCPEAIQVCVEEAMIGKVENYES